MNHMHIENYTIDNIAELIHDGWAIHYKYWRDNKPWNNKDIVRFYSYNDLGDERRDNCVAKKFEDLPDDEKQKDMVLAKFILSLYKVS